MARRRVKVPRLKKSPDLQLVVEVLEDGSFVSADLNWPNEKPQQIHEVASFHKSPDAFRAVSVPLDDDDEAFLIKVLRLVDERGSEEMRIALRRILVKTMNAGRTLK